MEKSFIEEVQDYCRATGISPSTLGVRALGNSRFFERLQRKIGKVEDDAARVRDHMAANPPQQSEAAK
ncbi:hypothetical protein [Ketogulonicigenium vulgare]|uniref:hypothetical protein n=1 Tax=Ketogulonicigenium vulgare TaxID=92945 RepID=UPI0023590E3E|nr:hypothetical protein [Ketogulonicigenium vulgare]